MRLASHSPFEASIMGKQIVTSCLPDWYRMCQPGLARLCLHEFRSKGVRIGRKEVVGLDGEAERRVAAILSSRSFEPHSTWHPQSTSHLSTGSSDPNPRGRLRLTTGSFYLWDGNRVSQVEFNQRNNCWQRLKSDNTFGRRQTSVNDLGEQRAEAATEAEAE